MNPSGRLPITFPLDLDQTPRPRLAEVDGLGTPSTIHYSEGAEVGYRWFAKTGQEPLFAFGHGLSYTSFEYRDLEVTGGETVTAECTIVNTGACTGTDVPQLYLISAPGDDRLRLLGFERIEVEPGQSRRVRIDAEPRLLAHYDGGDGHWRIAPGRHTVAVGASAAALNLVAAVELAGRTFGG